jgi:HK97 family phage major capsid protein/HK97 family phage prohead protease
MNRAYSVLTVKAVSDDQRIITGVATTPAPDRVGDIVEPLGVKFKNPMPLLHQHRSEMPVGWVKFDKPSKDGIEFEARLPHITEAGPLKDRVDTAWQEVKSGLVRGVSIGFKPIETSFMDDGGMRFIESEVLELSLVTIPANAEATIQTIKQFDDARLILNAAEEIAEAPAATGKEGDGSKPVPASRATSVTPKPKTKGLAMKTTAEKIAAFEASRAAKSAAMAKLMEDAGEDTLEAEDATKYDELKGEVKSIDVHLDRLRDMASLEAKAAKPVNGNDEDAGTNSRGSEPIRVSVKQQKLAPGIAFARYVRCKALSHVLHRPPEDIAEKMYPNHEDLHMVLKTDIPAANTQTSLWAGALVGSETSLFADFVEYLRPMTIIGQFGSNGIPGFRRVPFRTPLITQSATTTAYWVGEGQAKPLSKAGFTRTVLLPYKCAALTAATMEVLRDSSPSAETILREDIAKSVAAKLDADFLDPQKGLEANVSPASISNGVTPIVSSGRDADSIRADLVSVFASYISANNTPSGAAWVMSAITALQLSLITNALGQPEFPGMTMTGGRLQGLPVITSEYLGHTTDSPTEGRDVFLVNAGDIYFGDDGGIDVRMSTEASLEMEDGPANASAPTLSGQSLVSMFQTNSVAFLAERTVGWARRRTEAVVQLSSVEWGEAGGVNV